mgnify:CR=1 FL=1
MDSNKETTTVKEVETKIQKEERNDPSKLNNSDNSSSVSLDLEVIKNLYSAIQENTEALKIQKAFKHIPAEEQREETTSLAVATPVDLINKAYNDLIERNKKYVNPRPTTDVEQFIYTCKKFGIPDEDIVKAIEGEPYNN